MFQPRREAGEVGVFMRCDSFVTPLFRSRLPNINPRLIQVNDIFALFPKSFNLPQIWMSPYDDVASFYQQRLFASFFHN
jgi:hypothetical protein